MNCIKTIFQPIRRCCNSRQNVANQGPDNILRTTLDNWVNESPNEREVRQRVKDHIRIINGQLVVEGNLHLNNTNISSLPQGLHVRGYLNLHSCTSLTTLPQGLHVDGNLRLRNCTSLTDLPDWVFNAFDLIDVPHHLQQTDTYKIFQTLKHFDTHNTIDGINNQELIDLYNQNHLLPYP